MQDDESLGRMALHAHLVAYRNHTLKQRLATLFTALLRKGFTSLAAAEAVTR
jgi:hypothetical protein